MRPNPRRRPGCVVTGRRIVTGRGDRIVIGRLPYRYQSDSSVAVASANTGLEVATPGCRCSRNASHDRLTLIKHCYDISPVMFEHPRPRNPYRPGAAVSPLFLAGRDQEIRRFGASLRGAPELPANVRLTGLRGVGKSVLLKRQEEIATDDEGWLTSRIQVEPRHNTEADLSELILSLCHNAELQVSRTARIRETMKGVTASARGLIRVTWQDIELSLGPVAGTDRDHSIARALFDVALTADHHGYSGYLLMLDEAQVIRDDRERDGEHPLSLLIAAINSLQEKEIPIGLTLCGLPTLRANLLKARTDSERMFRGEEIGRLARSEAVEALVRPLDGTGVTVTDALVERVIDEVEGYPFFIQLWGAELWEAAQIADVNRFDVVLLDSIEHDIYRRLDIDFYDGRVESLTPAEQDLLMSTAECPYPPLKTADIHGKVGKSEGNVNVLMGRLADQGVVFRVQKGQYEYTAPKFHNYLQRRAVRISKRDR
jgi:hypothetical protein